MGFSVEARSHWLESMYSRPGLDYLRSGSWSIGPIYRPSRRRKDHPSHNSSEGSRDGADICGQLIEQNPQAFEKFRHPAIHGIEPHVDPALNRLVEEKLGSLDLSKGVILDGYPASKEQGDFSLTSDRNTICQRR